MQRGEQWSNNGVLNRIYEEMLTLTLLPLASFY